MVKVWTYTRYVVGSSVIKRGTHHRFYLLGAEVVHDGAAVVPQGSRVAQQSVDGHLGRHPDVGQVLTLVVPLGYVKQPLTGRVVLEQVGKL